jgi:hypothetical protein
MEAGEFFLPQYRGTRDFTQQQVHTTNATGFGAGGSITEM